MIKSQPPTKKGWQMLLTVRERLILQSVLPQEGDFLTLKILRNLQEDLSFTEEEIATYKFVQSDGKVTWDNKVEQSKEVEVGKKANDIIILALSKLNEQKKLRMEHFDLYERFVEGKDA